MDKFEDEVILLFVVLDGHVVQHVGPTEVKQRVDQHISILAYQGEQRNNIYEISAVSIFSGEKVRQ
jgi:hypothetical protein